jgi:ferredoxin-nitrate reductase
VVDPRRAATPEAAELDQCVAPGGDSAHFNALGRLLFAGGAADPAFVEAHTRGHEEYHRFLMAQDLGELCAVAGVPEPALNHLASLIAGAGRVLCFYCMGLNQSTVGMWKNNSLINLHLLTGQLGKPGAGPFSLTGQPNALGGREFGLLAHQLPAYRFVDDSAHRREVEQSWGRRPGAINPTPGLTACQQESRMLNNSSQDALPLLMPPRYAGTGGLFGKPFQPASSRNSIHGGGPPCFAACQRARCWSVAWSPLPVFSDRTH